MNGIMNELFKYFIFLQLSVQLLSVASYTVVLKQVKTLRPSVKVYRYDLRHGKLLPESNTQFVHHKPPLLGQRIYPVATKPGKNTNWKLRPPFQKEKPRYNKGGEKAASRDPRLQGASQYLLPLVSNQVEDNPGTKEQEDEVHPLLTSPQLGKSFASFGQEKGRVYSNPGEWAIPPVPQADEENTTKPEFTPSQLYLQIRHKNTVIHVPQSEALKDAETLEELINAPRLKELARTTHVQETYSEEGYEDAGYDHAGHTRHAQHGQVYDAKDEGRFRIKDPPVILDYDSDLEESKKVSKEDAQNLTNKLEPRITRSRSEVAKTSTNTPKNYKGEHIYSSRVRGPAKEDAKEPTFPSYFGEMPPTPDGAHSNYSFLYYDPPNKKSSKYRNSTKIYPVTESSASEGYTDFKPYLSAIDAEASPSAKSLKYSRIYSKKTKQLRLEPYSSDGIYSPPPVGSAIASPPPPEVLRPPPGGEESVEQRIVLPTIGYINSLTTAHFGKGEERGPREESEEHLTDALNLTQALDYLRSKKSEKSPEGVRSSTEIDMRTFEPMKLKKSRGPFRSSVNEAKKEVYLMKTRARRSGEENYEGNDESDAPHDDKNEEIAQDEQKRIEEENLEKEKYEAELREEISQKEKEILRETYKELGVEEDVSEAFPDLGPSDSESSVSSQSAETRPTPVDTGKYPFYLLKRLPENSALRYATDPRKFPKKSGYKMEFYESREGVIQCPDFHPDLEDLPKSNSSEYSEEQSGDTQRIGGLGDKIACLRMKYFDPDPFDNPIFKEREIDYVGKQRNLKKLRTKTKQKSRNDDQGQTTRFNPNPEIGLPTKNHVITQETRDSPSRGAPKAHRIIPVTEETNDVPPHSAAAVSNPVVGWRTVYHSNGIPQPQFRYSKAPRSFKPPPRHLIAPFNCLNNISKLAVLDGTENLTVECNDAKLFQEIIENVARLRIIPKTANEGNTRKRKGAAYDESEWVPILGPSGAKRLEKVGRPLSRRTDRVTKLKSEANHNASSDHYVIDELKEEENVRKGEVMEDMDHYMKVFEELNGEKAEVTSAESERETKRGKEAEKAARKRRESGNDEAKTAEGDESQKNEGVGAKELSKLSEVKRPLRRLSGRDFLVRYHRNRGRHTTEKTEDFWKVSNIDKPQRKQTETSTKKAELKTDSQQKKSSGERSGKFKTKKNSNSNMISEKSPQVTANPLNFSKIVTKVSKEISQSTDKPRIVRKHKEPKPEIPSAKPETTQQNSNLPASNQMNATDISEGPVLYYVVNLRSGRGRWITRYEKRGGGGAVKHRKSQKSRENSPEKQRQRKEA